MPSEQFFSHILMRISYFLSVCTRPTYWAVFL